MVSSLNPRISGDALFMAKQHHNRDAADASERIITANQLLERIPLNRSTIWKMCREGRFPRPIQLSPARIGWRWTAVLAWLQEREENPLAAHVNFPPGSGRPRRTPGEAVATK